MTSCLDGRYRRYGQPGLFVLTVAALLLLTGCPKTQLPEIMQPFPPMSDLNTEKVSKLIDQRAQQFQSLWGEGKVAIQNWEETYKFSEVFVLESPAHFRLETLGFLDQPVIFLTSDENMLSLYSKKHNTNYRGVASQKNLFKLSGINLPVEDMILVLSGNPPRLPQISSEWGIELPESQQFYLERISLQKNTIQRLLFDTTFRAVVGIEEYMLTNGELTLRVVFSDYRAEAGDYPLPAFIQIERPLDKVRVDIKYKYFAVNQPIDQELFRFTPPVNAKVFFIDDRFSNEEFERLAPFEEFRVEKESEQLAP